MTQATQEFDIAIIGGGMVGTSLASLLSASHGGWRVALIEANPFPADAVSAYAPHLDARSTALSFGSVEIFQQLGLWPSLQEHATAIRQVHVSDRGHFAGSVIDAAEGSITAVGYVIENTWLGSVLAANVQRRSNITCFSPARVDALVPQQQGAVLRISCGDESLTVRCKLAVIADGGDSPMRRALGIDTDIVDYRQTAIIANVEFSQSHHGIAYERFTEQGPLALLPLGEAATARRAALVWTLPSHDAATIMQLDDQSFLKKLQARFGYRVGRFERAGQRQAYPLQLITAREQIRSHLVLVGNAAHFLHPVAGQGFNLALRDCVSLVETLMEAQQQAQAPGELMVLQNYLQRQQRDQLLTIQFSDRLVRLFSSNQLPLIVMRHLGFISLAGLPPAKGFFAAQTMGTAGRRPRWQAADVGQEISP